MQLYMTHSIPVERRLDTWIG